MKKVLKNEELSNATLTDYILNNNLVDEVFEHYSEQLFEVEHNLIDNKLIYTSDFWDTLEEHTSPDDLLDGKYTWDHLLEDMSDNLSIEEKLSDLIDYIGKNEMIEFINSIL